MRKQHNSEPGSTVTRHLWTYPEAVNAVPYLRAVVRSLREQWLEMQRARLQVRRTEARPGRPDRQALIVRAETAREVERAQDGLEETFRELKTLDVYCLDPVEGLALIPFRRGSDPAWFVFDLFAPQGVEAWLFDADPPETRRALEELDPALWPKLPAAEVALSTSRGTQADGRANLGGAGG